MGETICPCGGGWGESLFCFSLQTPYSKKKTKKTKPTVHGVLSMVLIVVLLKVKLYSFLSGTNQNWGLCFLQYTVQSGIPIPQ